MPPIVRELRAYVGSPGTDQGSGVPLIRNVPGPVPFTLSTTWFAPEGGSWRLALAARDSDGQPVEVVSGFRWAKQHSETHDFGAPRSMYREQQTVLLFIERGGMLTFERQVNGAVVASTSIEVEVEMANGKQQATGNQQQG
jgi:hypothetical protein